MPGQVPQRVTKEIFLAILSSEAEPVPAAPSAVVPGTVLEVIGQDASQTLPAGKKGLSEVLKENYPHFGQGRDFRPGGLTVCPPGPAWQDILQTQEQRPNRFLTDFGKIGLNQVSRPWPLERRQAQLARLQRGGWVLMIAVPGSAWGSNSLKCHPLNHVILHV